MQGGVGDGGSESGSVSTVSREENMVVSSEDSSCPDQSELELGLGLSLGGGGGGFKMHHVSKGGQFARILTAKDLPSLVFSAASPSSSSSSSSSSLSRADVTAKTKRTADSMAAANGF
ncbi:hypothetical protein Golob_017282, partial [Gossypium lobatum]|nr:hypothetical protein [Gossypium lobatum]